MDVFDMLYGWMNEQDKQAKADEENREKASESAKKEADRCFDKLMGGNF